MFHPSYIKDELYNLTEEYCVGSNIYRHEVIEAITNFFRTDYPDIQADWHTYIFDDMGVFYIAWIEMDKLHTESFAWIY